MVHCPLLVPPAPLVEASDAVTTEAEASLPPFEPVGVDSMETAMDPTATVALPFAIFDLSELHAELGLTQLEE
eukprot:m.543508 g.543508  ORF g.543508 m.543508 type:complete len:73 (-) comp57667_c0_seq52:28-246(-)